MILLKREEFYLSWLSFLLIASLFSTGLHYFYGKNIYFIAAWGIQILMLLFFHSKIKQGSRKSLLFYPFSMIISIVFLIKLVIPSIRYNTDDFYKRIDNFIIKQEVSFYIKAYIPDHFKILCIFFFILFLFSFICIFYYYFIKVSLYKTQRFFNGFFSLTGISFILMLFFPLKEKHVVFLYMKDFDYLNRINYDLLFLNLSFFSGFIISSSFYILLSLIRDNKSLFVLFIPVLFIFYLSLFYLNLIYLSYLIFHLFLGLLLFYLISDGFKKFSYNN